MTVARLSATPGYARPRGVEGVVLRFGMALITWAHHRARRHDALRRSRPRRRAAQHLARLEAEREHALARAWMVRMF